MNRFIKILLLVVLSVFSGINLSANSTFFSIENKRERVYSFSVEDNHSYIVGANQILVHNDANCLPELFSKGQFSKLQKKFDDLPTDDLRYKFLKDFGKADNELLAAFDAKPELIDAWKKIDDLGDNAFDQLRKDPDFLKKFDEVSSNTKLNKHTFEGDVSYEILETGQKKWKAGGVHHKTAFDNGTARIRSGTKSTPDANGYYTAKVEIYHPEFPDNGGFKVKPKESTFFPDGWGIDKLQAEIAGAIKNKGAPIVYPDGRKLYKETMTDGTELAIWENAVGIITSTYPIL